MRVLDGHQSKRPLFKFGTFINPAQRSESQYGVFINYRELSNDKSRILLVDTPSKNRLTDLGQM